MLLTCVPRPQSRALVWWDSRSCPPVPARRAAGARAGSSIGARLSYGEAVVVRCARALQPGVPTSVVLLVFLSWHQIQRFPRAA